jgi:hypothetical protein
MMGKNTKIAVRSHSQEREWLLRLGKGDIFVGVQNLIQQERGDLWGKNNCSTSKREKSKGVSKR